MLDNKTIIVMNTFVSKGALFVNFSSIAIELTVPRDDFSSIANFCHLGTRF